MSKAGCGVMSSSLRFGGGAEVVASNVKPQARQMTSRDFSSKSRCGNTSLCSKVTHVCTIMTSAMITTARPRLLRADADPSPSLPLQESQGLRVLPRLCIVYISHPRHSGGLLARPAISHAVDQGGTPRFSPVTCKQHFSEQLSDREASKSRVKWNDMLQPFFMGFRVFVGRLRACTLRYVHTGHVW